MSTDASGIGWKGPLASGQEQARGPLRARRTSGSSKEGVDPAQTPSSMRHSGITDSQSVGGGLRYGARWPQLLLAQGVEAIMASFGPEREHPRHRNPYLTRVSPSTYSGEVIECTRVVAASSRVGGNVDIWSVKACSERFSVLIERDPLPCQRRPGDL